MSTVLAPVSLSRKLLRFAGYVVAAAVGLSSLGYGLERVWPFSIDDAGIVYAYARHLAGGQGLRAVVGGPTVEGYSDFLWVVLIALVTKMGFTTPLAAKILGSALLVWTTIAAALFVRAATKPVAPLYVWPLVVPAVLLGLCPEFVVYAPSGLENGLYGAALVTALWLDARESDAPTRIPWSALGALAVALTRPEGIVYGAILAFGKLSDALGSRAYRRQCSQFLGLLLVPWVGYHLFHYWVFRAFVPNTFFAKAPGSGGWEAGVAYVKNGLIATRAEWLLPVGLVSLLAGLRRTLPTLGAAIVALGFAIYARGDWMPHFRFVGFAIPPLALLAAVSVVVVATVAERVFQRDIAGRIAALGVTFALSLLWFSHHGPRFQSVERLRWCHFCSRSVDAANLQAERAFLGLAQASVLTHDFGGPSYASSPSFFPLDLLGLADQSAALIEYRRKKEGYQRADFARLQYFFHEQPAYPTFLFFPNNFWIGFRATPEFVWGYTDIEVPIRKDRLIIEPTALFRGAFVEFFPQVERFRFERVDPMFRLIGASAWVRPGSSPLDVELSLTRLEPTSEPVSIGLRLGDVSGLVVPLFGLDPSPGRTLRSNEPVSVHLQVPRPATAAPDAWIEAGINVAGSAPRWVPLLPLDKVRPDSERAPTLSFPNNLPGTSDPALRRLGRQLRGLIDERRLRGDYSLRDESLGRALASLGVAAEVRGGDSDAYLADVWATLADPDQVRFLYQRIAALRPLRRRRAFLRERALLGEFYASGDEFWQIELVAEYADQEQWDKARFFLDRLPTNPERANEIWAHERDRLTTLVRAAKTPTKNGADSPFAPRPIPGVASDFEDSLAGWTLQGDAFVAAKDDEVQVPVWGVRGERYLSSEATPSDRGRATGEARSAEFVIDGRALSFLIVGGMSKDIGVELVVDGKVAAHVSPPGSRCFFPVIWDVRAYRGRRASLRIFDHATSRDAFIAVDDFQMWPSMDATPTVPVPL